jgi:hypothetical protein
VLGNPPWERIKLQEQEFFATRSPDIAGAQNKAARERLIKALEKASKGSKERALFDAFVVAKREAEAVSEFARVPGGEGGRFALTGRGDVNTYALFAELFANLARDHAGVIVPTGIATDATTAPFFSALVEHKRLAQLVDFENRSRLFPAVDSRMKFCLLTFGRSEDSAHFAFFLTDPAQLAEPERNFILSPDTIARLNPNTKTAPVFRSRADAELTAKIYERVPVLIDDARGNQTKEWGLELHSRIWHMAEDSEWFRSAATLEAEGFSRKGGEWIATGVSPRQQLLAVEGASAYLPLEGGGPRAPTTMVPLYEAKMFHHFDHRWSQYSPDGASSSDLIVSEKTSPKIEPNPRYWVSKVEVERRLRDRDWDRGWLLGWRDICRATDERTVIFSILPRVAVGHTSPLLFVRNAPNRIPAFVANLASLTLDYVESVGGTHLSFGQLKQLPVQPPSFYSDGRLAFIFPRVLELTYTSHSVTSFACDLGYSGPPFAWDEDRRAHLRADLDASRAYGLDRDELRYILDPADVKGAGYPSETFRVLKEKEIRTHGEYRTRRLVLEAWDRMEVDGAFTALGM